MITEKKMSEHSAQIMKGLRTVFKNLVEETAAKGGKLVIGDKDGNIKHVPATELLDKVNDENYLSRPVE